MVNFGHHTMKAKWRNDHLLNFHKQNKKFQMRDLLETRVPNSLRPTILLLDFTIKTLQLSSNYQVMLIKPQEFNSKQLPYIQNIRNQRLGFSISFQVKPNILKLAFPVLVNHKSALNSTIHTY